MNWKLGDKKIILQFIKKEKKKEIGSSIWIYIKKKKGFLAYDGFFYFLFFWWIKHLMDLFDQETNVDISFVTNKRIWHLHDTNLNLYIHDTTILW